MVIFDLDQTLIDTSPVEELRAQRNWRGVMARAPQLQVYEGINALLDELHRRDQTLAIVTKSPDMVARALARQHGWPIDVFVGYHQVTRPKPDPEGLLIAMAQAGSEPNGTYHVGDRPEDTQASRAAHVVALGSAWGISDLTLLEASAPDRLFKTVADLRKFFVAELDAQT